MADSPNPSVDPTPEHERQHGLLAEQLADVKRRVGIASAVG